MLGISFQIQTLMNCKVVRNNNATINDLNEITLEISKNNYFHH